MDIETRMELFERHERHPIVARVLAQETTFEREVEKFYDQSTHTIYIDNIGIVREFKFGEEEDSQKRGKYPGDLVEILNSFSEEPLDVNKLSYESVREDYQRHHTNDSSHSKKIMAISYSAITVTGAGMLGATLFGMSGNICEAILSGLAGAEGFAVFNQYFLALSPKPNGTNDELKEYVRLYKSAGEADYFMNEHYRPYFIKKKLLSTDIE